MTKQEKIKYFAEETEALCSFSAFDGLESKGFIWDIDDYLVVLYRHPNCDYRDVHKLKIHYTNTRDYIVFRNHRVYMNDFIRV